MTARAPALPASHWFLGNARELGAGGLQFFETCEKTGPMVRARAYHYTFHIVTGPALIEEILVKKTRAFVKPRLLRSLRILFGDGLLTGEGEEWKQRRRLLQPVFRRAKNVGYAAILRENARALVDSWGDGDTRNVHPDVLVTCIENLTQTLFSVRDDELTRRIRDLASYCHEMAQAMGSMRPPFYWWLPPLFRARFTKRLRELEADVMQSVGLLRGRCPVDDDFYARVSKGHDASGCPLSAAAVRDEVVTMLLAGHETAAAAVSWGLQLLAMHPTVLAELQAEIEDTCENRLPTLEDLDRLTLLDQVLLETYRLYPPTHRIGRTVVEPVTIGGFDLVPNDEVLMPQWAVHRSSRWFDEPSRFLPSRWSDEAIARLPRFAYFPFSGGPRNCIGQELVALEVAFIVSAIVQRFQFRLATPSPIAPVEGLTLLPGEHGYMPLVLTPRKSVSAHPSSRRMVAPPPSSRRLFVHEEVDD